MYFSQQLLTQQSSNWTRACMRKELTSGKDHKEVLSKGSGQWLPRPYCCWATKIEPMFTGGPLDRVHPCLQARSCLTLATSWTVARQASLSMGFPRQEYWSGLLFPSPGKLPNPGIKPGSPALPADSLPSEPPRRVGRKKGMEGQKEA
ncbi:hypothetical protein MJG53_009370 [Ovis ammon polii x Ovis aries]|uniref:Uncharacterized protein n=1 Tax=Ovis ammon polii x Ovis aries TaxID=2918886 RepID=A0ACB9UX55_9CETA|nr:hypothetical protein MJG53_009370 [Ovis ammon polii x Ovis aries]